MRDIPASAVTAAVKALCVPANNQLPPDVEAAVRGAYESEPWPIAKQTLGTLCQNLDAARATGLPICQDTGMACVFAEIGQDVHITGGSFEEAVDEGVRQGYKLRLTLAPKGFGSENMSRLAMLRPSDGEQGVKDFVLDAVRRAGPNPCPPVVVGVGIGGTFDRVALLAKRALLRPLGSRHPDPYYAAMEQELLEKINELGTGPQGFGGRTTALGLQIETFPTHIAGLPVAVNINCHVTRHAEVVL